MRFLDKEYYELIDDLKNLKEYTLLDYEFIKNNFAKKSGSDSLFHYFIFTLNWQYAYFQEKIFTIHDLLSSNSHIANFQKRKNDYLINYNIIDSILNGKINYYENIKGEEFDLKKMRNHLKDSLTRNIQNLLIKKENKNIHEFFDLIFLTLGNVDYDVNPYPSIKNRKDILKLIITERLEKALFFDEDFKKKYWNKIKALNLSNNFILHSLLRHVSPFKIYFKLQEFEGKKIKNEFGDYVFSTAIYEEDGVSVCSTDGTLIYPNFSPDYKYSPDVTYNESLEKFLHLIEELLLKIKEKVSSFTRLFMKTYFIKLFQI